jgi:hypothetical protein
MNMKKGITIGAIIVMLGALIAFFVGGFQSGKQEAKPESDQAFGAKLEPQADWPVWSFQVAWQSTSSPDTYGPVLHQLAFRTKPKIADVLKYVPQPDYLPGRYRPLKVFNIVQVGPEKPVEIPEKK